MQFRTELHLSKSKININHQDQILMMGSCFSENIWKLLVPNGFQCVTNPFGTVYNAVSLAQQLSYLLDMSPLLEGNFGYNKNEKLFFHYDTHSRFNSATQSELETTIREAKHHFNKNMPCPTKVFITLGTSWVYRHIEQNAVVANCHKMPQALFSKELLSKAQVTSSLRAIIDMLHASFSGVEVIFTVSPVRHVKDGFVENNISKAVLILSVNEVMGDKVSYFPSYELLLDDLRDYRFYARDLIHPSDEAIDYLWQKFSDVYFTEETKIIIGKYQKLHAMKNHIHSDIHKPSAVKHQEKIQILETEIKSLLNKKSSNQ